MGGSARAAWSRVASSPTKAVAAVVVAVATAAIVVANRSAAPFSPQNIVTFLVVGAALGSIYAISASGLVVTYSTTGIFNFAHAAIGAFLAFGYWELRINRGWPAPLALVVIVFVAAPALGFALDILLMRRLVHRPLVIQLMVTVGLMLAFMGFTSAIWKPTEGRALPQFFQGSGGLELGSVVVTWHRLITIVVALGVAVLLRSLLYRTRLGISMRAVVDNRDLAAINGVRPGLVSGAAWALGCMMAAVAGILIAPEIGMVVENLSLVIIVAFAAAAIAQMKSLLWAFAGGLLIGLLKAFAGVFLSFSPQWSNAPEAIPGVVLLVALLFLPNAPLEPTRSRQTETKERVTTPLEALLGASVMFLLVVVWANGWIPWFSGTTFGQRSDIWLGRGAAFLVIGIIMLSLVPLIGWAGQVSFANFAIAGLGAVLYSKIGGQNGEAYALVLVALICAPLGAMVAIPALRLRGLYLALATMAFAEIADKVIFHHPLVIDEGVTGVLYQPLKLFGFRISTDSADRKAFVIFVAVAFCLLFIAVALLRTSRWARRWTAAADSPVASATIGVNLSLAKISVFAVSGSIAGFAGCLYGLSKGTLGVGGFPLVAGLPLVLLLALQGLRYPVAPFIAAVVLAGTPALQELLGQPWYLTSFELLGPGLLAFLLIANPNGIVSTWGSAAGLLPWRHDARKEMKQMVTRLRDEDITRDDINDLGLARPFTSRKAMQLEGALGVAGALDEPDEAANIRLEEVVIDVEPDGVPVG